MKILLLGKNGQVGAELQRALLPLGTLLAWGRQDLDLVDPEQVRAKLQSTFSFFKPDVIVNASAYTAVDKAESDQVLAHNINAASVAILAEQAAAIGAWLLHYSTDYVFDGENPIAYTEQDIARPLSIYGKTKFLGEQLIQDQLAQHIILRTSWVYGLHGNNFAKTMLRLFTEKEQLRIVADQQGVPTSAAFIADVTAFILYRIFKPLSKQTTQLAGIYHLTPSGQTTWHGYASYLFDQVSLALAAQSPGLLHDKPIIVKPGAIYPITTHDYPLPAVRPFNSLLNTDKLKDRFLLNTPDWRCHLDQFLKIILRKLISSSV